MKIYILEEESPMGIEKPDVFLTFKDGLRELKRRFMEIEKEAGQIDFYEVLLPDDCLIEDHYCEASINNPHGNGRYSWRLTEHDLEGVKE